MKLRLDRSIPVSLRKQIKGQITYAISYGLLSAGTLLPSVRELSATLEVAPMTISHVYRELAQEGLVVTKPGVGTFVADMSEADASTTFNASKDNLQQVIDHCLRQAMLSGHTIDEVREAFLERVDNYRSDGAKRPLLLVGNFKPATESYAREIEDILHDLNVSVTPILLDDLKARPEAMLDTISATKLVITIPTRLHEVRALLEPHHCRVVAVAFRVSTKTRHGLSKISPEHRVGIVSTFPEFLQTIVDGVALYGLPKISPACAILGQNERIQEMLSQIDVLVYASGCESILEWLPSGVRAIEFRHTPEPDSVNRLRRFLS